MDLTYTNNGSIINPVHFLDLVHFSLTIEEQRAQTELLKISVTDNIETHKKVNHREHKPQ